MSERTRIVLSGATGRMGSTLARLIKGSSDLVLAGGLDREDRGGEDLGYPELHSIGDAADLIHSTDVVIDFSAPEFLRRLLQEQREALVGRGLVVGTTGLGPDEERLLDEHARTSPVLTSANFSVGVNVVLALVEQATRTLGPEYDVEIVEVHHRRKEDAPSGTALALAKAVAATRDVHLDAVRRDGRSGRPGARPEGEIGLHALRGGSVIGEHTVMFIGEMERIELIHRAADRAIFASGALRAARWIVGRSAGRYDMRDLLGLR